MSKMFRVAFQLILKVYILNRLMCLDYYNQEQLNLLFLISHNYFSLAAVIPTPSHRVNDKKTLQTVTVLSRLS